MGAVKVRVCVVCVCLGAKMCVRPCHSTPACQEWLLSVCGSQLIIKAELSRERQTGERDEQQEETKEP